MYHIKLDKIYSDAIYNSPGQYLMVEMRKKLPQLNLRGLFCSESALSEEAMDALLSRLPIVTKEEFLYLLSDGRIYQHLTTPMISISREEQDRIREYYSLLGKIIGVFNPERNDLCEVNDEVAE